MYKTEASRTNSVKKSKPIRVRGWKSWFWAIAILVATVGILCLNYKKSEEPLGLSKQKASVASVQIFKPAHHNLEHVKTTH